MCIGRNNILEYWKSVKIFQQNVGPGLMLGKIIAYSSYNQL